MTFKQGINIPALLTIGAISIMVLIVLVLGTQAWFQSEEQTQTAEREAVPMKTEYMELKDSQKAGMQKYGWTDANKTVATVPIDQAMQMIVKTGGVLPATRPTGG